MILDFPELFISPDRKNNNLPGSYLDLEEDSANDDVVIKYTASPKMMR